jgi:hypothetical protein
VLEARVTVTDATGGGATITVFDPLFPSMVAVIVADPGATAVTSPDVGPTVAIATLDVDHVAVRPRSGVRFASKALAVSCAVAPTIMFVGSPETSTVATAGGPEESLHAMTNASVHSDRSASRGCLFIGPLQRRRIERCRRP